MSAGSTAASAKPNRDLELLAPAFRAAVEAAIADCQADGLDAMVFEAYRSDELQKIYYARGRTVIPPTKTVTNAPDNLYSWHGYGLAVDVVHRTKYWSPPEGDAWFEQVAERFKAHGCKWGGDWTSPDLPHMQWGKCRASPSDRARELLRAGGLAAVWDAVGANAPAPQPPPPPEPPKPDLPGGIAKALAPRPDGKMGLSSAGADLIKAFESCMEADGAGGFRAYHCPAGVLTIGWGHTNDNGRQFAVGEVWTQAECDAAFSEDMRTFEDVVHRLAKRPLEQNQFDALVAFAYNVGGGALKTSTLLRKLNAGDVDGAALEFHRWNRSGGKVLRGLVRRRASEALLFQGIADLNYDGVADGPMPRRVEDKPAATP